MASGECERKRDFKVQEIAAYLCSWNCSGEREKEADTGIRNNCPLGQRKHVCKWRRRHRQFDLGEKKLGVPKINE